MKHKGWYTYLTLGFVFGSEVIHSNLHGVIGGLIDLLLGLHGM